MRKRQTLKRHHRLHSQGDFQRVLRRRYVASDPCLVVYVDRNGLMWSRLGIRVSRPVGNAVERNRLKRLVREAFRLNRHRLPAGVDVICILKRMDRPTLGDYIDRLPRLISVAVRKLDRGRG